MILRISLLSAVSALCLSAAASAQEYCPQMIGMVFGSIGTPFWP